MKKFAFVVAALLVSTAAFASSVHLKGGKNAEPGFWDHILQLSAQGDISGLGNGDVLVTLEAEAEATSTCTNQGGTSAPGQNPAFVSVEGSDYIDERDFGKNGTTPFSVMTFPPASPVAGAPGCPNPNWEQTIDDLSFYEATITVEQPPGTTVLTVFCTIDPSSEDGAISKNDVECEQY